MWTNKKFVNEFKGGYVFIEGERVFKLSGIHNRKNRIITFESWQMAKKLGWVKK